MNQDFCVCECRAFSESRNRVSGYRFVTEGDGEVCELCRSFDGKVYRSGASSDELPKLPLHPNCRCRLVPIVPDDAAD